MMHNQASLRGNSCLMDDIEVAELCGEALDEDPEVTIWENELQAQSRMTVDIDAGTTRYFKTRADGSCLFYSALGSNNIEEAQKLRVATACMSVAHVNTKLGPMEDGPELHRLLKINSKQEPKAGEPYDPMRDLDLLTYGSTWGSSALYYPIATLLNRPLWVVNGTHDRETGEPGGARPVTVFPPLEQLEHAVFHGDSCENCNYDPKPVVIRHTTNHYDRIVECIVTRRDGRMVMYNDEEGLSVLPAPATTTDNNNNNNNNNNINNNNNNNDDDDDDDDDDDMVSSTATQPLPCHQLMIIPLARYPTHTPELHHLLNLTGTCVDQGSSRGPGPGDRCWWRNRCGGWDA